jgi:aspartate 4-decarboxylase
MTTRFTMKGASMGETVDYGHFEGLSPFEIKDELIRLARAQANKSALTFLNAGRGNPNWIATRAREAFFLLGQFALTEARRTMEDDEAGLAGIPRTTGEMAEAPGGRRRRAGRGDPRCRRRFRHPQIRLRPGRLRA